MKQQHGLVRLIQVTPEAEKTMGYVARVSNPNNQENPKVSGLLKYCVTHQHWSVFEQAFMTLEIETTRGLAAQILRHRSFTYQEFSQRYADSSMLADEIPLFDLRRQDTKNRQNSIDDIDPFTKQEFEIKIKRHFEEGMESTKKCLTLILQRSVLVLCFLWQHQLVSTCLVLFVHGSITSPFALRMAHKKNTWILLTHVSKSLLNNFLQYLKHLNGNENSYT